MASAHRRRSVAGWIGVGQVVGGSVVRWSSGVGVRVRYASRTAAVYEAWWAWLGWLWWVVVGRLMLMGVGVGVGWGYASARQRRR